MSSWHFDSYYPPTRPKEVKGGIKAQNKRGAFGTNWWAKRWIEVLDSFCIGQRLSRGRSYARRGQVVFINIEKGQILSDVQGSGSRPYKVKIKVKTLSKTEWKKVAKILSSRIIYAAKLFSGEMPENIEDVFKETNLTLFPKKSGDLETNCSCPDWSNPCKHIAAVYYLLAEEFDRDPFLIFKMRGMDREGLMKLIGGDPHLSQTQNILSDNVSVEKKEKFEPLPADPEEFWKDPVKVDISGEVRIPPVSATLPKRLGKFPFWQGKQNLHSTLENIYAKASRAGLDLFLGEE